LQQQEANGKIDLYYFDEAGFALDPTIPYAWQEAGEVIELPAMRYGRINVLGFMNRNNDLHAYMFEQSIHTGVVIGCFDAFCHTITHKTVVVMDHASIHRSEEFEERLPYWKSTRSGCENLSLAITSVSCVSYGHGNPDGIITRHLGAPPPRSAGLYSGA
jgi:DDE superfamily endonuclease